MDSGIEKKKLVGVSKDDLKQDEASYIEEINKGINKHLAPSSNREFVYNKAIPSTDTEAFLIIKEIHSILKNCTKLTNEQKLDYCNSERYFMKLYLKKIIKNLIVKRTKIFENF
ncbi:MAG: hypothetical protein ACTSRI_14235 [Promethearchaeota archaeon]